MLAIAGSFIRNPAESAMRLRSTAIRNERPRVRPRSKKRRLRRRIFDKDFKETKKPFYKSFGSDLQGGVRALNQLDEVLQ